MWMKHYHMFQEVLVNDPEKKRNIVAQLRIMEKDNFEKIVKVRNDHKARMNIQKASWEDFSRIMGI